MDRNHIFIIMFQQDKICLTWSGEVVKLINIEPCQNIDSFYSFRLHNDDYDDVFHCTSQTLLQNFFKHVRVHNFHFNLVKLSKI